MSDVQEFTSWRPEAGDSIKGSVAEISTGEAGYGPYPIVTLETGEGEVSVHAFHTVLRNQLAERRPKIGDELTIKYFGKQSGKNSTGDYHAYRVTGGSAPGYDWSQEAAYKVAPGEQAPPEPDVPVASEDLPDPQPVQREAPTQADLDKQFGDVPF